jgi:hypothetical protein
VKLVYGNGSRDMKFMAAAADPRHFEFEGALPTTQCGYWSIV